MIVAVVVPPVGICKYELQNVVAGAWSDFKTDSAPVIALQPVGVGFLFGRLTA